MIQDIYPSKLNNHYEDRKPKNNDIVLIFKENNILILKEKNENDENEIVNFSYMTYCELISNCCYDEHRNNVCYLFSINEISYFMVMNCEDIIDKMIDKGYELVNVRTLRKMCPQENAFAGATAWHLYGWYKVNKFCGGCGCEMKHDTVERMMFCPKCGYKAYPRINPAVIIGLQDGERLMMTKYCDRAYKNYALIAGFAEIGETIEETVEREVMEEVGLKVKNIQYYKSQPWGFDSDLLMGFFCELDSDDRILMDENELSVAEWMNYKDIPDQRNNMSLTAEMMMVFKDKWINKK